MQCSAMRLTVKFLEDALHGARAAAAGHGDVEFVLVIRHVGYIVYVVVLVVVDL